MRFLSKIILICNSCFIVSVLLRYVEMRQQPEAATEALGFQPLTSTLIILGYGAVVFNFMFLIACLFTFIFRKESTVPRWILLFNLVLFFAELIYFLY